MLKFGVLRGLALLLVVLAIPYGLYRLSRVAGVGLMIAGAVAIGLAYGVIKADNAWTGDGLFGNLRLMATSALVLAAYVGASVWIARVVARRL